MTKRAAVTTRPSSLVADGAPFDGSCNHADIRTFYTSELAFLKAMRKRYACQWCGASSMTCPSCQETNARIAELEADHA